MSLELNSSLMFLVFAVFLVLIFALDAWLYRPLLAFMRKRDEALKGGLSALDGDQQRMKEIDIEIQRLLKDAREEAKKIKDNAINEAQKKYNESFERARFELENHHNESKKNLNDQHDMLSKALGNNICSFSNLIKEKIAQMRNI